MKDLPRGQDLSQFFPFMLLESLKRREGNLAILIRCILCRAYLCIIPFLNLENVVTEKSTAFKIKDVVCF